MKVFVTGASGWIGSGRPGADRGGPPGCRPGPFGCLGPADRGHGWLPVQRGDVDDPDGLAAAAADAEGVIHLAFQHEVAFGGNFAAAAAAGSEGGRGHGSRPGRFRSTLRACVRHARAVGRQAGHGERRTRPEHRRPCRTLPDSVGDRPAHLLVAAASAFARRCCASRRPSTASGDTDSSPPLWRSPGRKASRDTSVTARIVGRPSIARTPPASSASPSRQRRPGQSFMQWATKVCRFVTSPKPLAVTSTSRLCRYAARRCRGALLPLGHFASLDSPARPSLTRELLGWQPTGPGLIEDLDQGHYFGSSDA